MAVPPNPFPILGYYCGDQPSDWMKQGARIYISVTGNNAVPAAVIQMVAPDPGIIAVDYNGDLYTYDVAGSKAVGTWRWTP